MSGRTSTVQELNGVEAEIAALSMRRTALVEAASKEEKREARVRTLEEHVEAITLRGGTDTLANEREASFQDVKFLLKPAGLEVGSDGLLHHRTTVTADTDWPESSVEIGRQEAQIERYANLFERAGLLTESKATREQLEEARDYPYRGYQNEQLHYPATWKSTCEVSIDPLQDGFAGKLKTIFTPESLRQAESFMEAAGTLSKTGGTREVIATLITHAEGAAKLIGKVVL